MIILSVSYSFFFLNKTLKIQLSSSSSMTHSREGKQLRGLIVQVFVWGPWGSWQNIKPYSIQVPLRCCHSSRGSLCEAGADWGRRGRGLLTPWLSLSWAAPTADDGTPLALGGVGLQVLGLQRLHVILVDFQGGAELYGQSGEDVVPGHQEKRLAIDFLSDGGEGDARVSWDGVARRVSGSESAFILAKFVRPNKGFDSGLSLLKQKRIRIKGNQATIVQMKIVQRDIKYI